MTEIQTAVAQYLTDGLCIIPVPYGTKQPTIEWQQYQSRKPTAVEVANWFNGHPTNLAVICGQVSDGLVILDFDDDEQFALYQRVFFDKSGKGLLDCTRLTRGSRGGHVWFRVRQSVKSTDFPNCEVRSDGRIVILPPSLHPNGCQYQMLNPGVPILEIGTLTDVGIDTTQKPRCNTNNTQGQPIPEGQRNAALASLAGTMRRRGMSLEAMEAALLTENNRCLPPLPADDVKKIASSIARYEPANPVIARTEPNYVLTDKNGHQSLDQDQLACDLMAEFYFKTLEDTNQVLIYRNGVYQTNGEQFIRAECQRRVGLRSLLTEHRVNEIVGHIRRSTYTKRTEFNKPGTTINLLNGLLDTSTRTLSSHAPKFLSTVQLPLSYQPTAKGARIQRFLSEILNTSDVPLITELFGFCLLQEYRIQKAFLLVGEGANGKSTLLKLLIAFVGEANCSHVSWQQLEGNRFAMADLEGKLVNSFADLPSQGMSMTTAFKMLTGGDSICAERKFMPSFNFVNFAKLVFSTNKPPKVEGEDSFAFWRRWVIVEFPHSFTGDKDNPNLIDELITSEELSGLLNMALDGLDRIRMNRALTYGRSVEETSEYYLRAADPVYAFIQDCCEIGTNYWVSKEDCYNAFKANCEAKQIPLLRPNSFARSLQNQPSVRISATRPQVGENRVQAWQGIKLVDKLVPEQPVISAKENPDGKQQTLTEPRLPSGMSGQNGTSIAYAHEDITLKLQENPGNPDATLKTEFQNPDGNNKKPDGRTAAVLGISINDVLTRWRKQGAPMIHLGQGQNCLDLELLLSDVDTPEWQLLAVKTWLDKNP